MDKSDNKKGGVEGEIKMGRGGGGGRGGRGGGGGGVVFFFNDTATTEIYTLSLHDALPISYILSSFRGDGSSDAHSHLPLRESPGI